MAIRLPSAHQHNFSAQPQVHIQRSAFDRKHSNSFTFDAGYLIPFFHDEVLPGDTINLRADIFARLNTPYFPIMTNVYVMVHFWSCANRLVWNHWVNFMGEKDDPDDVVTYLTPQSVIPAGGYAVHSLQDYFGLPVVEGANTRAGLAHNVFLLRMYNLVWNKGYRDQNLQDPVVVDLGDGPDITTNYKLLKRGKRHDYFTSCLPWPQKGDPVQFALGGSAPVWGSMNGSGQDAPNTGFAPLINIGLDRVTTDGHVNAYLGITLPAAAPAPGATLGAGTSQVAAITGAGNIQNTGFAKFSFLNETLSKAIDPGALPPFYADLTAASAISINQFRQAFLTQELLEIDARGGTRYPEMIYAHFGVENPDARMQYPEYLGGSITNLDITSVPQTSETTVDSPQGNLAAFGTFHVHKNGFVKSFTEHGHVFGLLCVYADLTYSQGLARHWSRRTRYDFYFPVFANLGEQAVLNKEIFAQGTAGGAADGNTLGFQERWAEYRYMPNRVGGLFRPGVAGSLAAWNLSQEFATVPTLNAEFIVENPPFDRVVVVTDEPDFKADAYIQMTHVRPMPVQSIPVKLGGGGRRAY